MVKRGRDSSQELRAQHVTLNRHVFGDGNNWIPREEAPSHADCTVFPNLHLLRIYA